MQAFVSPPCACCSQHVKNREDERLSFVQLRHAQHSQVGLHMATVRTDHYQRTVNRAKLLLHHCQIGSLRVVNVVVMPKMGLRCEGTNYSLVINSRGTEAVDSLSGGGGLALVPLSDR